MFVYLYFYLSQILLCAQTPQLVLDPKGHISTILDLQYLKNDSILFSSGKDKTIRLWNLKTQKLIKTLYPTVGLGKDGVITSMDIHPTSPILAVGLLPHTKGIMFLNYEKEIIIKQIVEHTNTIQQIQFSGNGQYIVSSSIAEAIIWEIIFDNSHNITDIKKAATIGNMNGNVRNFSISPNSKILLINIKSKGVFFYNIDKEDQTIYTNRKIYGNFIEAWFVTDEELVTATVDDYLIKYNTSGKELKKVEFTDGIIQMTISNDCNRMIIDGAEATYSFSLNPLKIISQLNKEKYYETSCSAILYGSEPNQLIASAEFLTNKILIWNSSSGEISHTISGDDNNIYAIGIAKDILGFSNSTDYLSDVQVEKVFGLENFRIDTYNKNICLTDVNHKYFGKEIIQDSYYSLKILCNNTINNFINYDQSIDGDIFCYSFTNNGDVIIGGQHSLKYFNVRGFSGMLVKEFIGHRADILGLAIDNDRNLLVSTGNDQTINFYNLNEKGERLESIGDFKKRFILEVGSEKEMNKILRKGRKTLEEIYRKAVKPSVKPLASLFISKDNEWIIWTPDGYFACSENAGDYAGWLTDNGKNEMGTFYPLDNFFEKFYQPSIIHERLGIKIDYPTIKSGEHINVSTEIQNIPSIQFITPSVNLTNYSEDKIDLSIEILKNKDFIKEILVYQNGKLIQQKSRGFKAIKDTSNFLKITCHLVKGLNEIKTVVLNDIGFHSNPAILNIYCNKGESDKPDLYILAVGINRYLNNKYNLQYAVKDATYLTSSLIDGGKNLYNKINHFIFKDDVATKENIFNTINEISKVIEKDDVFVFYFAGHGVAGEQNNKDRYYLALYDVTQLFGNLSILKNKAISDLEIKNFSKKIEALKQVFFLDACYSENVLESFAKRGSIEDKALYQLSRSSGIHILASSMKQQESVEFGDLSHGIFTYSIIEGLQGNADGKNQDGKITINEIKAWIEDRVPELSKKYSLSTQYPTGYGYGQDFPLVVTK